MDSTAVADYSTGTITTVDGLSLFYRRWDPKTGVAANVLIVHGLGERTRDAMFTSEGLSRKQVFARLHLI